MKDFNAVESPRLALILQTTEISSSDLGFFCTIKIWTVRVMRPCPENKWPFSPALQNAWESLDYKAKIGPVTNKEDSDQPAYPRCQNLVCLHQ